MKPASDTADIAVEFCEVYSVSVSWGSDGTTARLNLARTELTFS